MFWAISWWILVLCACTGSNHCNGPQSRTWLAPARPTVKDEGAHGLENAGGAAAFSCRSSGCNPYAGQTPQQLRSCRQNKTVDQWRNGDQQQSMAMRWMQATEQADTEFLRKMWQPLAGRCIGRGDILVATTKGSLARSSGCPKVGVPTAEISQIAEDARQGQGRATRELIARLSAPACPPKNPKP